MKMMLYILRDWKDIEYYEQLSHNQILNPLLLTGLIKMLQIDEGLWM